MNGLQINIFRSAPGRGFHFDAFFRDGSDPILVQGLDEALRASGLPIDKFNVMGKSYIGEFGRLIFNGHNPDFYTTHVVDFRTSSSLETTISKFTAILTMIKERLALEEIGVDEGVTMPAPNERVFLELQRQRAVDAGSAFADQNIDMKDRDVFTLRARTLGLTDDMPMDFGLLAFRMGAALKKVRLANPELYEHYGEALRADPFLRNVFYKEPLDASHLSHPESVNPTGSLSPHAHDADSYFNAGGLNGIINTHPTVEQLQFVERDGK